MPSVGEPESYGPDAITEIEGKRRERKGERDAAGGGRGGMAGTLLLSPNSIKLVHPAFPLCGQGARRERRTGPWTDELEAAAAELLRCVGNTCARARRRAHLLPPHCLFQACSASLSFLMRGRSEAYNGNETRYSKLALEWMDGQLI